MTIGIIGADDRAVAIGRIFQQGGNHVTFSDPNGETAAQKAVDALGGDAKICTAYDQAATSDALVMVIHWEDVDGTLRSIGSYKDGLVIDATRPAKLTTGTSGAEILAKKLDNRHVVKAFVDMTDPQHDPIRIATDDPEARKQVEDIIRSSGIEVEDLGPLANACVIELAYEDRLAPG